MFLKGFGLKREKMGVVGNFLFVAMAVNFGMILFALTMIIVYKIFLKESADTESSPILEEETIEEATKDMEEVPLDI